MARSFAGGTDKLQYGNAPTAGVWQIGAVAFWYRFTSATVMEMFSIYPAGGRNGFGILANPFNAGRIYVEAYDNSAPTAFAASTNPGSNDDNWHHFAYNFNTNNGAANSIYSEGALVTSANASKAWPIDNFVAGAPINLGADVSGFYTAYSGSLADLGLWIGGQLTADEIAALAKGASPDRFRPDLLELYVPLVRDTHDLMGRAVSTISGTSIVDHPRVLGGSI